MKKWLPDWKNPRDYPLEDQATPEMWAWEFLRRNSEYQLDYSAQEQCFRELKYSEACRIVYSDEEEYMDDQIDTAEKIIRDAHFFASPLVNKYSVLSNVLPSPYLSCMQQRVAFSCKKNPCFVFYPVDDDIDNSDGGPIEVSKIMIEKTDSFNFKRHVKSIELDNIKSKEIKLLIGPLKLLVEISLEDNILAQVESIKNVSLEYKRVLQDVGLVGSGSRKEVGYYNIYLRCLDALECDFSKADIISYFLPNEPNTYPTYNATKKVNNWLKRATELRDRDYIRLASM